MVVWHVVARAKGYAFGLANNRGAGEELTLKLMADDVPVSGRIIDLEGRPVAGVIVKVLNVRAPINASLDAWLKALEERKELHNLDEFLPNRLEAQAEPSIIPPVTTGSDGTFALRESAGSESPDYSSKGRRSKRSKSRSGRVPVRQSVRRDGRGRATSISSRFMGPGRACRRAHAVVEGVVRDQDTGKPLAGIMVRGERSLSDSTSLYVQSITDTEGKYRLNGLARGKEGHIVAVPPCDFPVYGHRKAELKVPGTKTSLICGPG